MGVVLSREGVLAVFFRGCVGLGFLVLYGGWVVMRTGMDLSELILWEENLIFKRTWRKLFVIGK